MAQLEKSMLSLKVDERRFNRIFGNILKDFQGGVGPIIRQTALNITADIMRPGPFGGWPVDTGRSRMAWAGMFKMMGQAPIWEGNDTKAQAEGFAVATAKDRTRKMRLFRSGTPHVLVINPVRYAPPVNAQHGNIVQATTRRATKDMIVAIRESMKESSKENQ